MGYFANLMDALLGRSPAAETERGLAPTPDLAAAEAALAGGELEARLAGLEMDLRERDSRMAAMRREYEELEAAGRRATASAGAEQVEQLFKKLAPTLSNLAALTALAAAGRTVEAQDLLQVVRTVEKQMRAAGLETVGEVGATAEFDVALHQRMSGGMVTSGTAVSIRTPGYRFAGKVLLKAMVTAREQAE